MLGHNERRCDVRACAGRRLWCNTFCERAATMPAPQYSTFESKNRSNGKPKRRYTLAEANRALPLVTRIVRDIVNAHERATQLQAKIEELPSGKDSASAQTQLDSALDQIGRASCRERGQSTEGEGWTKGARRATTR